MANYITRVRTEQGDMQIDYEALANLPVANKSTFDAMMAQKQNVSTAITQSNIITYLQDKTVAKAENANNASKLEGYSAKEFAKSGHTHDDRYFTESEIDGKLSGYSTTSHTHNYAGSSTAGGAANSVANALKIIAGGCDSDGNNRATSIVYDGSNELKLNLALLDHKHWDLDIIDVVAIDKGGTGADNAATALSNLGGFPAERADATMSGYAWCHTEEDGQIKYLNPPCMVGGGAYLSFELFNDSPVYVAVYSLGSLIDKEFDMPSGITNIVDFRVYAINRANGVYAQLPWFNDDGIIYAKSGISFARNQFYVRTFTDASNYEGYAVLKYTL